MTCRLAASVGLVLQLCVLCSCSSGKKDDTDGVTRCYAYCQMSLDEVDKNAFRTMSLTEMQYLVPATRCEACHRALHDLMARNYRHAGEALELAERFLKNALRASSEQETLEWLAEDVRSTKLEFVRSKRELARWSPEFGDLLEVVEKTYDEIDRWDTMSVQEIIEAYREA